MEKSTNLLRRNFWTLPTVSACGTSSLAWTGNEYPTGQQQQQQQQGPPRHGALGEHQAGQGGQLRQVSLTLTLTLYRCGVQVPRLHLPPLRHRQHHALRRGRLLQQQQADHRASPACRWEWGDESVATSVIVDSQLMGQREGLSSTDEDKLRTLYQCGPVPVCQGTSTNLMPAIDTIAALCLALLVVR